MAERIQRITRPGVAVALLLCASVPLLWNRFAPVFTGDPIYLQLTETQPDDAIEVPAEARSAERVSVDTWRNEQRIVFAFDLEDAGDYSIYGISSNRSAEPLDMVVNGRRVSATAFFQKTGGMRGDFEKHLIARDVVLGAGRNRVSIAGRRAGHRTVHLELRREAPLGPLRYATLFAAVAGLLALRGFVVNRCHLAPRARLGVAALTYAGCLAALVWLPFRVSQGHLVSLGEQDPVKAENQRQLEEYLRSDVHDFAKREKFSVFVMGDSTHYWSLQPHDYMVPVLERTLSAAGRDDIHVYGISGGALNAFDFYLILNRIAREEPDLIVVPVGLRSFSEFWLHNDAYRYPGMDHYLAPSELLRARNLSVAGREVSLVGWSLRRVDAALFGGRVARLLRGAKLFFENERDRVEEEIAGAVLAGWEPVSEEFRLALEPRYPRWNLDILADHELLEAFRLINALAARHGIDVLYYTVQINVEDQLERGRDVRIHENFAVIERAIAGGPGVHFLSMIGENPRDMFSDHVDHLTPDGIASVAAALVREIIAIERANRAR